MTGFKRKSTVEVKFFIYFNIKTKETYKKKKIGKLLASITYRILGVFYEPSYYSPKRFKNSQ